MRSSSELPFGVQLSRVHGAYDLEQVLLSEGDFMIIDFEGDPSRSLQERKQQDSPLRDVASMARSFHYAASFGLGARAALTPQDQGRLAVWATWWRDVGHGEFSAGLPRRGRRRRVPAADPAATAACSTR